MPEMHKAIRERKDLLKKHMLSKTSEDLQLLHRKRNLVNSMVDNAKGNFIKTRLHQTKKNPKRFWMSINNHAYKRERNNIDVGNIVFRDPLNYNLISQEQKPDFLNRVFVNIAEDTRSSDIRFDLNIYNCYSVLNLPGLDFTLPDIFEIR